MSKALQAQKRTNKLILILIFLVLGVFALGFYAFVLPGQSGAERVRESDKLELQKAWQSIKGDRNTPTETNPGDIQHNN
jgi:flagellar basal body-associated protein FliL